MEILAERTTAAELEEHCGEALRRCESLLSGLLRVTGPRTKENTLDPLNEIDRILQDCWGHLVLLRNVHPNAALREAAATQEKRIAGFSHDLGLNKELWGVMKDHDPAPLDRAGKRWLERLLRDFHRSGADRDDAVRAKVRGLQEDLLALGQDFVRNIVTDVRGIELRDASCLAGLPEDYVAEHPPGPDGRIRVSTDYPDYTPFMSYAKSGEFRRQLYTEFRRRAYPANMEILDAMLAKRQELASLLGYSTWAEYATEDKMVNSPREVSDFIDRLYQAVKDRSNEEYGALLEKKREQSPGAGQVADWEKAYLGQLVRLERYNVDSKKVREYFEFPRVRTGLLSVLRELFGVEFETAADAPRWHEDVEVFDFFEEGRHVGRIYLDMHPREGKFKHAAVFPLTTGIAGGRVPEAALVCNFPNPHTANSAALLEHQDVVTFFHEFGHLLHHLFSRDHEWSRFNGISTEWDFMEVPSQLFEEWAWDYEVLRRFATHYETGETIPATLVKEMCAARDFGCSLRVRHQLFYSALSLSCHHQDTGELDTNRLVRDLQERYSLFGYVEDTHFQASFGHLGDYSALYYTYLWSLVIEKDLLDKFGRRGLLDPVMARKLREDILAPGGSRDAVDLVRKFLGRGYSFDAFRRWLEGAALTAS